MTTETEKKKKKPSALLVDSLCSLMWFRRLLDGGRREREKTG